MVVNMELTLTPNAFPGKKLTDVSHKMHPRLENIVFYKGNFEKHANGLKVAKVPCTKYAAYAQREKPGANNKETPVGGHRFT